LPPCAGPLLERALRCIFCRLIGPWPGKKSEKDNKLRGCLEFLTALAVGPSGRVPIRSGRVNVDLIFSTENLAQAERYAAWRDAICDVYVHVDVHAEDQSNYDGFIREIQFGSVALTDVLLSHQQITRRASHLPKLDKDCYYVQLIQTGNINFLQDGATLQTRASARCSALPSHISFSASGKSDPTISNCRERNSPPDLPKIEFRFRRPWARAGDWGASPLNSARHLRLKVPH
jgi:hypothetical protein